MEFQPPVEGAEDPGFSGSSPVYKGRFPKAAFFHVAFKALALLFYFFGETFVGGYIVTFVLVVLLLAADFWVVKNVSGRMMVALRWWNDVSEDGNSQWRFECGDTEAVHPFDSTFFWGVLYGQCGIWGLLFVLAVMGNWRYIPLVGISLVLAMANALGYTRCRKDAKKRLQDWVTHQAVDLISKNPDLVSKAAMTGMGTMRSMFWSGGPQQSTSAPAPAQTSGFQPTYDKSPF